MLKASAGSVGAGLVFREDFTIWENELEEGGAIAGSIDADKYIIIPAVDRVPISRAIEALQEGRTAAEIQKKLLDEGWEVDVEKLVELLFAKRLVNREGSFAEKGRPNWRSEFTNDEVNSFSRTLFSIKFRSPFIQPERVRYVIRYLVGSIGALFLIDLALIMCSPRTRAVTAELARRISVSGLTAWGTDLALVGLLALLSFVLHETGHVVVARRHGLYLRSVQFRFYRIFQSYVAVQIPGICTLSRRAQIEVALAGPLANLLLGLFLLALAFAVPMPAAVVLAFGIGAVINLFAGLSNMNPFFPTDGYRFVSVVLFNSSDVRSYVVAQLRSGGFRALRFRYKVYLGSYLVSTVALLGLSNYFLVSLIRRLLSRFLPACVLLPVIGLLAALIDVSYIGRTVRFLRGKG